VLANLFLHYAFDLWMQREYPTIPFERYADDAICHCASEEQALDLRQALEQRFAACRLRLHPQKTKIVYCKDANRPGEYPERSFDFLGYTFRSRVAVGRGRRRFVSFIPAVSNKAAKRMRQEVRRWGLHLRSDLELEEIANWVRPTLSGWVRYYGLPRDNQGENRVASSRNAPQPPEHCLTRMLPSLRHFVNRRRTDRLEGAAHVGDGYDEPAGARERPGVKRGGCRVASPGAVIGVPACPAWRS
jgi:Reverse transcriptase (RNA-dependent DNA polymerase)/Group II intron, maturase-specific domain